MTEMTPADVAALSGGMSGNNSWLWIIVLFFIFAMNGGGIFGNSASAAVNAVSNDFLYTNLSNQIGRGVDSIANTLNTGFTAVAQQGFAIDKDLLNQTNTINTSLNSGFATTNANITNVGYQMQQCCCDLKTAIHSEGEATRALIQNNTIQDLRDQLAQKDNTLQSAELTLANAAQTQNLLSALGKYVPTTNTGCACSGCSGVYA